MRSPIVLVKKIDQQGFVSPNRKLNEVTEKQLPLPRIDDTGQFKRGQMVHYIILEEWILAGNITSG